MSTDPHEYQVPVMIDVTAYTIEDACAAAEDALRQGQVVGRTFDTNGMGIARVESTWMIEEVAKAADGNDNEHGIVIFQHDLDYLATLLRQTPPATADWARHQRLLAYVSPEGRCGSDTYNPLPKDWRRQPTAALEALLDTLDDSTQEWDAVIEEIRERDHHDVPADTPSLEDSGPLPTYTA